MSLPDRHLVAYPSPAAAEAHRRLHQGRFTESHSFESESEQRSKIVRGIIAQNLSFREIETSESNPPKSQQVSEPTVFEQQFFPDEAVLNLDDQTAFSEGLRTISSADVFSPQGIEEFRKAVEDTRSRVHKIRAKLKMSGRHRVVVSHTTGEVEVYPLGPSPTTENMNTPVSRSIGEVIRAIRSNPSLAACISTVPNGTVLEVRPDLPKNVIDIFRLIAMRLEFNLHSGSHISPAPSLLQRFPDLEDELTRKARHKAEDRLFSEKFRRTKAAFIEAFIDAEKRKVLEKIENEGDLCMTEARKEQLLERSAEEAKKVLDCLNIDADFLIRRGFDLTIDTADIDTLARKLDGEMKESFGKVTNSLFSLEYNGPLITDALLPFTHPEIVNSDKKKNQKSFTPFPREVYFTLLEKASKNENLFITLSNDQNPGEEEFVFIDSGVAHLLKQDSQVVAFAFNALLHRAVNATGLPIKPEKYRLFISRVSHPGHQDSVRNPEVLLKIPLRKAPHGIEADFDPEDDDSKLLTDFVAFRERLKNGDFSPKDSK